jgi:TatA/E family protein of Tat protein translocase
MLGVPFTKRALVMPARRGNLHVCAAFFGVGAPEAVLVGVVALILFGPKGLAQAAKSLGATLRAFAPTVRELTQVSAELKSTLEEEIGLNDLRQELSMPPVPKPRPPISGNEVASAPSSSSVDDGPSLAELRSSMEENAAPATASGAGSEQEDIERMRQESALLAWGGAPPQPSDVPAEDKFAKLDALSVEELEAELERRRAASSNRV